MRIEPEISSVSVILLGDFNPAIFTPAWFALHGLLPKGAADRADLKVAHPQTTSFTADWLQLNVLVDRFSAETTQAPHIRLCDLVVRVFREHLFHTPFVHSASIARSTSECGMYPLAIASAGRWRPSTPGAPGQRSLGTAANTAG